MKKGEGPSDKRLSIKLWEKVDGGEVLKKQDGGAAAQSIERSVVMVGRRGRMQLKCKAPQGSEVRTQA